MFIAIVMAGSKMQQRQAREYFAQMLVGMFGVGCGATCFAVCLSFFLGETVLVALQITDRIVDKKK